MHLQFPIVDGCSLANRLSAAPHDLSTHEVMLSNAAMAGQQLFLKIVNKVIRPGASLRYDEFAGYHW
jgi:hypothetical protein